MFGLELCYHCRRPTQFIKCTYNVPYTRITIPIYGGIFTSNGKIKGTNVPIALPFPHPIQIFIFLIPPQNHPFSHRNRYRKSLLYQRFPLFKLPRFHQYLDKAATSPYSHLCFTIVYPLITIRYSKYPYVYWIFKLFKYFYDRHVFRLR